MNQRVSLWSKLIWLVRQWWLRLSVGLALLLLLAARVNWMLVAAELTRLGWQVLALIFLVFFLLQVLYAWRWRFLLRSQAIDLPLRAALGLNYLALFASNFLPGSVGGDALKWVVASNHSSQHEKILASIVVDRVINLLAILILLVLLVPLLTQTFGVRDIPFKGWWLASLLIGSAAIFVVIAVWVARRGTSQSVSYLTDRLSQKLSGLLDAFKSFGQPWVLLIAVALSGAAAVFGAIGGYALSAALGMNVSFLDILRINLIMQLAVLLPITFNGIGITELGYIVLLSQLAVNADRAATFALVARLLYIVCTLPGAWYWFVPLRRGSDLKS